MKNRLSLVACLLVCIVLLLFRLAYSDVLSGPPVKVTTWDACGYYLYLPSTLIYHDCKDLKWLADVDKKYAVTGGDGYQAERCPNGNYVFKYLGGVALMELPLFGVGHWAAGHYGYPRDGFCAPYQYAIAFGVLLYCMLAIFLLRSVLLRWFKDATVAITLVMVCLATNLIEYVAIEGGQSHAFIFPLYALVLYTTMRWHRKPGIGWAVLTGYVIGLATISRPTEAIMLFIPLMWNTHTKKAAKAKWQMVKAHKAQVALAALGGLMGILPQLIYWRIVTGSFFYDVGSKWDFLNPHFRVLFGFEKGWFIYTPVTVFFVAGMLFIKKFPFRKSVLWFCLLNIYIIIAWNDWRYGGSYSTRALMQSYPVFALPFAAITEQINARKWKVIFRLLLAYLLVVNLFQITQYNKTIIHFNDMNRPYYGRVYLNPHPTPADMSLLDNDEYLSSEKGYSACIIAHTDTALPLHFAANATGTVVSPFPGITCSNTTWLKIEARVKAPGCLWQSFLNAELKKGDSVKTARVRLFSPISQNDSTNNYTMYMTAPAWFTGGSLRVYISSPFAFDGIVRSVSVTSLQRKNE